MTITVHPRINIKHPSISNEDVLVAWENYIRMAKRLGTDNQFVAIGFDKSGRAREALIKSCHAILRLICPICALPFDGISAASPIKRHDAYGANQLAIWHNSI